MNNNSDKLLIRASIIAILGNLILAVSKLIIGIISDSLAVIGDGLDTTGDIVISAITFYTAKVILRPPSPSRPFGYYKADALASKILSFIIIFAGLQLFYSSAKGLITGSEKNMPEAMAIYVTIFSIAGKTALTFILFLYGKKSKSNMIIANAKNMRGDIVISLSVLTGLAFTFGFKMPILDYITAILVSLWIIWVGYGIFKETITELLDGTDDISLYDKIFEIVESTQGAYNPHRARVRKVGAKYSVCLDIEVTPQLTITEAHAIAAKIEKRVSTEVNDIYDVIIHIEPLGDDDKKEKYGATPDIVHGK